MAFARYFRTYAALLVLAACTGGGTTEPRERQVPLPGREQRLQFYFVFEKNSPWGLPPVETLRQELGARIEFAWVENAEKARAFLRESAARPADLILLGPGLPQKVYAELQLAQTDARQVVAFENSGPITGAQSLKIDTARVRAFAEELCQHKFSQGSGCEALALPPELASLRLPKGKLKLAFGGASSDADLSIVPNWVEWLRRSFLSAAGSVAPAPSDQLRFADGLLELRQSAHMAPALGTELQAFLKTWKLKELTQ